MTNTSPVIGIYHKNCNDGTTAAAVLLKKFPHAKVFPLKHGYSEEDIQPILEIATLETVVYTVDCALGIDELLSRGVSVTTIDHHIGIQKEMEEKAESEPLFTFIFKNERSGAALVWEHLFPNEPMPRLIELVEDVDLWNWNYGDDSKHIRNYLFMFSNKPEEVLSLMDENTDEVIQKGSSISSYADTLIAEFARETNPVVLSIGEHKVQAYNTPYFHSELGSILSEQKGETVGFFSIKGDEVKLSFRGKDGQSPTALDLAQPLGGGGHVKAAGAAVSLSDFKKMLP